MRRLMILLPLLTLAGACSGEKSGGKPVNTGASGGRVALLLPGSDKSSLTAPAVFRARFETSKGNFVMEVHRDWAPGGADRFYYLVKNGFFDDTRFFRAIDGFMVQFGLSGDPKLSGVWREQYIYDDSVKQSNKRGFVSYAKGGPNTRTTQIFINFADNARSLDSQGFSPFAQVVEGMDVVDQLYKGYGDGAPRGKGPDQSRIRNEGNKYLDADFPQLDKVIKATVVDEPPK
jgi:peptidyl-prolyl cis-trans isomerase A (cyclophilin A)